MTEQDGSGNGFVPNPGQPPASRTTEREFSDPPSAERLALLFDFAPLGYAVIDCAGGVRVCNHTLSAMMGIAPNRIVGSRFADWIVPELRGNFHELCQAPGVPPQIHESELCMRRADGSLYWALVRAGSVLDPQTGQADIFVALMDVTEGKRAHETAKEQARKMRALASQVITAEARERRRLAHVLHDGLQQILSAARIRVDLLKRDAPAQRQAIEGLDALLVESLEATRSLTCNLSPPVLMREGLPAALGWLANWFNQRHGLRVSFHVQPHAQAAEDRDRHLLFDTARECLFNVCKYAQVNEARLALEAGEGSLVLTVSDSGKGFDPCAARTMGVGGFGLCDLRDRLEAIGGCLEIDSRPGRGTTVRAQLPIQARAAKTAATQGEDGAGTPALQAQSAEAAEPRDGPARTPVRILVVDDHRIVRQGLRALLSAYQGLQIVAEAADGFQAVQAAAEHRPDVVIMDVSLPLLDGIEATRRIKAAHPEMRVIGFSMHEDPEIMRRMKLAGAEAFVLKSSPPAQLIDAIQGARVG